MIRIRTDARWRLALVLAVLATAFASANANAQPEPAKPDSPTFSEIRDSAKMFNPETVVKSKANLERVERATGVATFVETVNDLGDESIEAVMARHARRWGKDGIYVLIDRKDRKFLLTMTGRYRGALETSKQVEIRDAFLAAFKKRQLDEGLRDGVFTIEAYLNDARTRGKLAAPVPESAEGAVVVRNQVRLTLAGARQVVAGAEAKAGQMTLKVNIAVVDDGGHLLTFARMDGARPASGYTAITKATSAATLRQESGPLPKGTKTPDPLLNLSLQNAAEASGGKVTTLHGGVPIVVDGQVIGAVGVGGGAGEQDAEIARAGVARFEHALKTSHDESPRGTSRVETRE